ncbi:hypothetical protein AM588_10001798 [Phytophthora nicotianae]|uniref:Poly(A) polymerase RNA-binding domain-containing protein n=1 Tax=Phytophthora nicotianae TaxID=4792 RepID=A0A0W8CVM5_PHYNI|nr:hypothetical protein AM588_10001798 [Phytophthora nicotianae]
MVMRHDSSKQQAPAPIATRAFSFKDAVVRSPPKSLPLPSKDQPVQPSPKARNDKKPQQASGSRQIRSRSITKIVESSSFKKRCEALKSHPGRKHHDSKGESATTPLSSPRAKQETKKLTPLEELCEREKLLHNSSDSFKARKRINRSTSCSASSPLRKATSSSDKDDGSSQDRVLLRRASLPLGSPSDSDTQSSSCDSSPVKAKKTDKKESISAPLSGQDSDVSELSHELAVNCSTTRRNHSRKVFESDDDFLDCDDTNSESTAESSCPSPRHSPLAHRSDVNEMEVCQKPDELSSILPNFQVSQPTFSVIYEELWRARYLAEIAVGISKPFPTAAPSPESSESDLKAAVVCMATSMPSFDQPLNAVQSTAGETAVGEAGAWDKLFQPSNFFIRYSSYMVFNFQADTESAMHKWGKFVQSRLRKLVDNLHHVSPVSRVHAFPCYFPHTSDSERDGPGSCMFIGIEFHCRRHQTIQPKDDPEVKKTLEQTIRFFLATDLQQMEDKQPDMTADAKVLSWEELPDFVFQSGRSSADLERAKYTDDLEKMGFSQGNTPSFRPPYYVNSYNRNGKWRSGGRASTREAKGSAVISGMHHDHIQALRLDE